MQNVKFNPIGTTDVVFEGNFKTISNLTIKGLVADDWYYGGLGPEVLWVGYKHTKEMIPAP